MLRPTWITSIMIPIDANCEVVKSAAKERPAGKGSAATDDAVKAASENPAVRKVPEKPQSCTSCQELACLSDPLC